MSTQIKYVGKNTNKTIIVNKGAVTLHTADFALESDIEITTSGGEELPEWNITDHTITGGDE